MATYSYLVSGLLMGTVLLVLIAAVNRTQHRREVSTAATATTPQHSVEERVRSTVQNPTAWIVAFFLLVLGFGGGTILFVSGGGVPGYVKQLAGFLMGGIFAVLMTAFVFWGIYDSGRSRGIPSAQAVAIGFWVLGLFVIVLVALKLVLVS